MTHNKCAVCKETIGVCDSAARCQRCHSRYHEKCVGEGELTSNGNSWFCASDKCQAEKIRLDMPLGSACCNEALEEKIRLIEKEKRDKMLEIEAENILKEKELDMRRMLREMQLNMDRRRKKKEEDQERRYWEQSFRDQQDHLGRMKALQGEFMTKINLIQQELQVIGNTQSSAMNPIRRSRRSKKELLDTCSEESDSLSESEEQEVTQTPRLLNGLGNAHSGPSQMQLAARNGIM
ncbi:uncharacterized protein LOC129747622 isoform X2 [Uranotaenia lowii]|uniref:uncharacterized protein LOC129747622 isoform X2 n=1 Tax=Uranotaenia lowii TaxID=190385 RepID=UPI002479A5F7|nr:uncharacterized protein LOC129747622 isoform X2 [Uranotaenia lowii]